MHCPSCGGEIEADKRFAHMVVCPFCESAVVLDEAAARVSGKMAVLAQTPSPLYVGGTGTLFDRQFTILGRVRYGYSKGFWDEWFLGFDDGSMAWISEDENNFSLETWDEGAELEGDHDAFNPGDTLRLGDTDFHVDEKDVATCEGGEGQLPFPILSGEEVPFLDLSTKDQFATIEFEEEGVRIFRGRHLNIDELHMTMTAQEAGVAGAPSAERAATEGARERIVKAEDRAKSMNCFACGAPLGIPEAGAESASCEFCGTEIDLTLGRVTCVNCGATVTKHGDQARSLTCAHCNSQLDVSKAEPTLLTTVAGPKRPKVPFKIGQQCTFHNTKYTLIGHLRLHEKEGHVTYRSDEFLLFNKAEGYRWLVMEAGHFSLASEMRERPTGVNPVGMPRRTKVPFAGKTWRVFESGQENVVWVDGQLTWVAKVGDRVGYCTLIHPPESVSIEFSGSEIEYFRQEYLQREGVAEAFGIENKKLPFPRGVAPNQPYPASPFRRQSKWVFLAFGILLLFLAIGSLFHKGRPAARLNVPLEQYDHEVLTEDTFEIKEPNALCKAVFRSAVDNSWVYMDVAVVDDKENAVLDFSTQMSYYHGRSGGESWSEGSQRDSVLFKLKEPGTYRLLALGQAGKGSSNSPNPSYRPSVTVTIYEGVTLARYHFILGIILLILAVVELIRRSTFEQQRWGGDDDDD